jgi:hypothetical protein
MKTTEELLYQIRGLARMVVAFSVGVSGLAALWPNAASSWLPHLVGLAEIGLALWLIIAFTSKTPLWATGAALIALLLDSLWVAPTAQGLVVTVALLALMCIDMLILNFDPADIKAHQVKQYIRFTRDRMLYEFVKRLELKDLPHLMHTLTQLRLKRRNKNRLKQRSLLKAGEEMPRNGREQGRRTRESREDREISPRPVDERERRSRSRRSRQRTERSDSSMPSLEQRPFIDPDDELN